MPASPDTSASSVAIPAFNCPACGARPTSKRERCLACGMDFTLLHQIDGVADAWFNRGIEAAAEGEIGPALEWLAASCAARPTDAAARCALAKVWAQMGSWEQASRVLDRAASIDPNAAGVVQLREAIGEAAARSTVDRPSRGGLRLSPKRRRARCCRTNGKGRRNAVR